MNYFDTSFLMPFVLDEPGSAAVERFLKAQPTGMATTSLWTCVEFSSAMGQQVRIGRLSSEEAIEAESGFDSLMSEAFVMVAPTAEDFEQSRRFLRRHETGLRSGDVLHLAIASNRDARAIYTLDRGFLKAGQILSLPVKSGIRVP